jgi:hypothetical protein
VELGSENSERGVRSLAEAIFFVGVRSVLVRKANETREHRSVHERSNALGGKCCCNLHGL